MFMYYRYMCRLGVPLPSSTISAALVWHFQALTISVDLVCYCLVATIKRLV